MDSTQMEECEPPVALDSSRALDSEQLNGNETDIKVTDMNDDGDDDEKPFAWHLRQKKGPVKEEEHVKDQEAHTTFSTDASAGSQGIKGQPAPKFVTKLGADGKSSRMGALLNGASTKAVALPPRPPPPSSRVPRQKEKGQSAPKPGDSIASGPSSSWPNEPNNGASPLLSASPVEGTTVTPLQTSNSQGMDTSHQLTGPQNNPDYLNSEEKDEMSSDEGDEQEDGNGETSKRRVVVEEDEKMRELWKKKVEDGISAVKGMDLNELRDLLPPPSSLNEGQIGSGVVPNLNKSLKRHSAAFGVSHASDALSRLHIFFHSWPQPSLVKVEEGSEEGASTSKPSAFQERSQRIQQSRESALLLERQHGGLERQQDEGMVNVDQNKALTDRAPLADRAPVLLPHSSSSAAFHRPSENSEPPLLLPLPAQMDPTLIFPPSITKGFVFNYSAQTMRQAVKRARYGARRRDSMSEIGRDTMIFFWNFEQGMLHGAFLRNGEIEALNRDSWRAEEGFEWSCKYLRLGPDLPFIPAELTVPIIGLQGSAREGRAVKMLNEILSKEQCIQLWDLMVKFLQSSDGKRKWSTEEIYESLSSMAELEPAGSWMKRVPATMQGASPKDEDRDKTRSQKDHSPSREEDRRRSREKDNERERENDKDRERERGKDRERDQEKDLLDEERKKRREKEEKEREERDREDRDRERRRKREQEEKERELRRERERRRDRSRERERDRDKEKERERDRDRGRDRSREREKDRDRDGSADGRKRRSDREEEAREDRNSKRR